MTVTVLAILETDFRPDLSLGKIMNERLKVAADDLRDIHLQAMEAIGQRSDDLVVYISYNPKYKIRWRIVNDVPEEVEHFVPEHHFQRIRTSGHTRSVLHVTAD